MSSGGSKAPAEQTITQSNIPTWAEPYAARLLGEAEYLTYKEPYREYGGQRIAGFNPLQQQAFMEAQRLGPASQLSQASEFAGLAGLRAGQMGDSYQPMQYGAEKFGGAQAAEYMSPYMTGVVEQQKQAALQDYARQIPGLQAQGIRSGARGGTREALLQAEAQRGLQQQLGGIEAAGRQQAFQQAQQQFGADRAAQMQAQQMMEQSRQFGAGLGLQGVQQQLAAAQALGGLGQTQFGQQQAALQGRQQVGSQLQQLEQQRLEQQYQDFLDRQRYPYTQIGFMSDILRGIPATAASQQIYQAPPSALGQAANIGLGLTGLYGAFKQP